MNDLRQAAEHAVVMLKTGMPEYDAHDVLEVLEAALEQPVDDEYEVRADGMRVRKDRWQVGIRRIVALLWGNRKEFEIDEVVEAVCALVPQPFADGDDEALVRAALEQPEQEPVAWMTPGKDIITCNGAGTRFNDWTPLYTHPPRREWRGLSKDETMHLMNDTAENYWADEAHIQRFSRALELKLKERNA